MLIRVLIKNIALSILVSVLLGCTTALSPDANAEVELLKRNGYKIQKVLPLDVEQKFNGYMEKTPKFSWLVNGEMVFLEHDEYGWAILAYNSQGIGDVEFVKLKIKGGHIYEMYRIVHQGNDKK